MKIAVLSLLLLLLVVKDPFEGSMDHELPAHQEDPYDDNGLDDFDISYNNYSCIDAYHIW